MPITDQAIPTKPYPKPKVTHPKSVKSLQNHKLPKFLPNPLQGHNEFEKLDFMSCKSFAYNYQLIIL